MSSKSMTSVKFSLDVIKQILVALVQQIKIKIKLLELKDIEMGSSSVPHFSHVNIQTAPLETPA